MTPDDRDRAAREIEELRQLFSANGRPVGRRFDAIMRSGRVNDAEAAAADERAREAEASEQTPAAEAEAEIRQRARAQRKTAKAIEPPPRTRRDEQRAPVWDPAPRDGTSRRPTRPPSPPRAKDPPVKVFDRAAATDAAPPEPEAPAELPGKAPAAAREPARRPVADADWQLQGHKDWGKEEGDAQAERRRSLRRAAVLLLPVLLAATFAAGLGLGRKLDSSETSAAAASVPVSASTVTSTSAPPPPPTAPSACLDAARYGDQVIALLTANIRDRRINDPMRNYAKASQACRAATSAP
jgi:hypothetical protein